MAGPGSWARLDELLDAALDQPPERRRAWLSEVCAEDEGLRSRALSLLELAETDDAALAPGGALRGPLWDEVAKELEPQGGVELSPGSRLGPYEIRALLGAGGMGRVYRAHDRGHDREVALKVLSEELAAEPSSLRRFEREAKLLSRLSHENIARLHGFDVLDGRPVLVLELAEGETLDVILNGRSLHPADAMAIARQVAEALAEAHGKGIVHRDLKPSNVKVSSEGRVKVLDFGLARRLRRAEPTGDSTSTLTHSGMVLGTIPYMSPEQAQGERVDERTDIWALGCLLYEMLTGRRAMSSRTVADLLESLLRDDVDLSALPPGTPAGLRRVIRRCLRREPGRRYQDVRDARLDLEEVEAEPESHEASPSPSASESWLRSVLPWTVAGLALMGALGTLLPTTGRDAPPPGEGVRRLVLDLPPGICLPREDPDSPAALSPDGSTVVLVGEEGAARRLYLRRLEDLAWDALPGTEGARQPFLSADGSAVGFFCGRRLMKVSLDGGEPVAITDVVEDPGGGTWSPQGTIVFGPSPSSGLVRVDARGGTPQPLTELAEGEVSHRWPQVLPDGGTVLFTVEYRGSTFDDAGIETVSLETGRRRRLMRGGTFARLVPGGHIAYAHRGQIFSAPFDLTRARLTGAPVHALDDVATDPRTGATKMALAADGTLAYVPAESSDEGPRLVLAEGWARSLLRRDAGS